MFLLKKRGSLRTLYLKQLPLLMAWPRGYQGPSDPLLMPGVLCLSSQGAACPAPSCAPMLCSDSWSSAGPLSPGSDPASAPSTRSCRVSESGIGETGAPLLKPVASAGKIIPPHQLQVTPLDSSSSSWTPASGIYAAGRDAALCLLCIPVPARDSSSRQK